MPRHYRQPFEAQIDAWSSPADPLMTGLVAASEYHVRDMSLQTAGPHKLSTNSDLMLALAPWRSQALGQRKEHVLRLDFAFHRCPRKRVQV